MSSTASVARAINTTGGAVHQGWETISSMSDTDVFRWIFSGSGTSYLLMLGRALGPGAFFQYTSYARYAIERTSESEVKFWDNGVSSTVSHASASGDWWCIVRNGDDYEFYHLNTLVHTWANATAYKLGHQAFGDGTRHTVHNNWPVVAAGGTISEGAIRYELVTTGGASGLPLSRLVQ